MAALAGLKGSSRPELWATITTSAAVTETGSAEGGEEAERASRAAASG